MLPCSSDTRVKDKGPFAPPQGLPYFPGINPPPHVADSLESYLEGFDHSLRSLNLGPKSNAQPSGVQMKDLGHLEASFGQSAKVAKPLNSTSPAKATQSNNGQLELEHISVYSKTVRKSTNHETAQTSNEVLLQRVITSGSENHQELVGAGTTVDSSAPNVKLSAPVAQSSIQATLAVKKFPKTLMKELRDGVHDLCEKRGRDITTVLAVMVKIAQIMVTGTPIAEHIMKALSDSVKVLQVSFGIYYY
jgi:hypothetical protein